MSPVILTLFGDTRTFNSLFVFATNEIHRLDWAFTQHTAKTGAEERHAWTTQFDPQQPCQPSIHAAGRQSSAVQVVQLCRAEGRTPAGRRGTRRDVRLAVAGQPAQRESAGEINAASSLHGEQCKQTPQISPSICSRALHVTVPVDVYRARARRATVQGRDFGASLPTVS